MRSYVSLKYEPRPEVWLSRCSTRTFERSAFVQPFPPRNFETGSWKESRPSSTSWPITTAVNILSIEPRLSLLSRRMGTPWLRSATPRAASKTTWPSFASRAVPEKASASARRSRKAPSSAFACSAVSGGSGGVPFGGRAGWICRPVIRSSGVPSKVSESPCQPAGEAVLRDDHDPVGGTPVHVAPHAVEVEATAAVVEAPERAEVVARAGSRGRGRRTRPSRAPRPGPDRRS